MHNEFRTVSVVGLGYIGLPTAATIASHGIDVVGVDVSQKAVSAINEARAHFSEPDLDGLVHSAVVGGRLKAFTAPQPADAFIVAVPTPVRSDKSPDMAFVEQASRAVAAVLKPGDLVILESTSPVGTTEWMAGLIREERPDLVDGDGLKISMAYCPERILPGRMVYELVQNDRIVGGLTPACAARAKALYATFVRGSIYETSAAVAELVKLIENAYRDVNIAFANEVANICERMGLDTWEAIGLANKHPRVNILNPGPGVGGIALPSIQVRHRPASDLTPLMQAARGITTAGPRPSSTRYAPPPERAEPNASPPSVLPTSPTSTTCARARRSRSPNTWPTRVSRCWSPSRMCRNCRPPLLAGPMCAWSRRRPRSPGPTSPSCWSAMRRSGRSRRPR